MPHRKCCKWLYRSHWKVYGALCNAWNGAWCVFPDFEIPKYRRVHGEEFWNVQRDLKPGAWVTRRKDFILLPVNWALCLQKNEIEKNTAYKRTGWLPVTGVAGFSRQGNGISQERWIPSGKINVIWKHSAFSGFAMPLFRWSVPGNLYTQTIETFKGIEIFHYGNSDLQNETVHWYLKIRTTRSYNRGKFAAKNIRGSNTLSIDSLEIPRVVWCRTTQFGVSTDIAGVFNDWNIWVYPATKPVLTGNDIYYTDTLDAKAESIFKWWRQCFPEPRQGRSWKGKEVVQHFRWYSGIPPGSKCGPTYKQDRVEWKSTRFPAISWFFSVIFNGGKL